MAVSEAVLIVPSEYFSAGKTKLKSMPVASDENTHINIRNTADPLSASIDEATADIIKTAPGLLQKASRCSAVSLDMAFFTYRSDIILAPTGYPDNMLMGNSTINRKGTPKSEKATLSKMAGFSEKPKVSQDDMTINGKREGTMVFIHRLSPSRAADDILSL